MAFPIVFNSINVNGQYTNGTVSIGENLQSGWSGNSKNNFGVGPTFGMNFITMPVNFINDTDLLDSLINNPYNLPAAQNQLL